MTAFRVHQLAAAKTPRARHQLLVSVSVVTVPEPVMEHARALAGAGRIQVRRDGTAMILSRCRRHGDITDCEWRER